MKTIIQILTALLGIYLLFYSILQSAQPTAIASNLMFFENMMAQNEQCAQLLDYGSESGYDSFADLISKVVELRSGWRNVGYTGTLLILLSVIPLVSNRKNKSANHGLESTGAPPAAGTPETHP